MPTIKHIPNKIGTIREFDGINYELKSTDIKKVMGETYRESIWSHPTERLCKTFLVKITGIPDVDVTKLTVDCLEGKLSPESDGKFIFYHG